MSNTAISTRFLTSDKSRGAPARLQYSQVSPHTGTESVAGQVIRFKIPSNRVGTYLDADFSFLQMTVVCTSLSGDITTRQLAPAGIGSFFKQIIVRNAGSHLSDVSEYGVWRHLHMYQSVPKEFLSNDGNVIMGSLDVDGGRNLANDKTLTLCDFLTNLSSVFQTNKYIPLFSSDSIEIDLVLGDKGYGFIEDLNSNATVKFTDIKLNLAIVECAPEVDREIISAHQGVFKYLLHNSAHYVSTIPAANLAHTFNIGCSYSSLNRIDFVMVDQGNPTTGKYHFVKRDLKKATLLIDGVPVIYTSGQTSEHDAVNLCYARGAQHALGDMSLTSLATNTDYSGKRFIGSFDLEALVGRSETLRSGMNVSASTVQLVLEFSNVSISPTTLHVFCYYDALMSMDIAGTRQFEISI